MTEKHVMIARDTLVNEARSLRSDGAENSEYDRALVELVGYSIGAHIQDGDLPAIEKIVLKDTVGDPVDFVPWEM